MTVLKRVVQYFVEICKFAICGLAHLRSLRICDSSMSPRICRFACPPLVKAYNVKVSNIYVSIQVQFNQEPLHEGLYFKL
jgi:hypothetical protein